MENRDRDKVSQGTRPTEAGDINRDVEQRKSDSNKFGEKIGESENLEPNSFDEESNIREDNRPDRSELEH